MSTVARAPDSLAEKRARVDLPSYYYFELQEVDPAQEVLVAGDKKEYKLIVHWGHAGQTGSFRSPVGRLELTVRGEERSHITLEGGVCSFRSEEEARLHRHTFVVHAAPDCPSDVLNLELSFKADVDSQPDLLQTKILLVQGSYDELPSAEVAGTISVDLTATPPHNVATLWINGEQWGKVRLEMFSVGKAGKAKRKTMLDKEVDALPPNAFRSPPWQHGDSAIDYWKAMADFSDNKPTAWLHEQLKGFFTGAAAPEAPDRAAPGPLYLIVGDTRLGAQFPWEMFFIKPDEKQPRVPLGTLAVVIRWGEFHVGGRSIALQLRQDVCTGKIIACSDEPEHCDRLQKYDLSTITHVDEAIDRVFDEQTVSLVYISKRRLDRVQVNPALDIKSAPPVLFINAPRSVELFLNRRLYRVASAFVGTLGEIDDAARKHVFEQLLDGNADEEAHCLALRLYQLRQRFDPRRLEDSLAWFLYVYYGNPFLELKPDRRKGGTP